MNVPELVAQSLVHFLWQGALLGCIAAAGLKLLPPRARCGFACLCLVLMAAAPITTFAVLASSTAPSGFPIVRTLNDARPLALGAIAIPNEPRWTPVVLGVWLAGVLFCAARAAGGWALAMRRTANRQPAHADIARAAREIADRLGIRQTVRVFATTGAQVPTVFGAWKPVILLPLGAIAGLSSAQLEAILAHELAHVARHDFLINCLQCVVEAMLFYHPAVWWLSQRIRDERELACDVIAADLCGDRVLYSRALLALEEGRHTGLALAATGGDLHSRIERLLGIDPAPRAGRLGAAILAVLLAGGAASVALRAQQQPKPESPYQRWLDQDVVYIIEPAEKQRFESLTTDEERQQFIGQFWLRRDPTPGTPANEVKEEHYRRIAYAGERFVSPTKSGWVTDRGRIYIVNGPPDEIESHPWIYARSGVTKMDASSSSAARSTHSCGKNPGHWGNLERSLLSKTKRNSGG